LFMTPLASIDILGAFHSLKNLEISSGEWNSVLRNLQKKDCLVM